MGAGLLRVSKLKKKWQIKLAKALETKQSPDQAPKNKIKGWLVKYAMFWLPFVTVLREGLEAIVFIGGVGLSQPAKAFPLAVICGVLAGVIIGIIIYKLARHVSKVFHKLTQGQGRKHGGNPDFPHRVDMLPLSHCCRSAIQRCLVSGGT